eukprot:GHVP01031037.1.p1 GENE.GHVP01031037.1~~GHVP01031037.1.p1  ORF type:complete len:174 (-),score=31.81 GHVP01031037.1:442-963(-)
MRIFIGVVVYLLAAFHGKECELNEEEFSQQLELILINQDNWTYEDMITCFLRIVELYNSNSTVFETLYMSTEENQRKVELVWQKDIRRVLTNEIRRLEESTAKIPLEIRIREESKIREGIMKSNGIIKRIKEIDENMFAKEVEVVLQGLGDSSNNVLINYYLSNIKNIRMKGN